MFILILSFCLLLGFGLIYWARKSYWVPFGVDFTLIKNGPFRVRTSYTPYFKSGYILFGVGLAFLGVTTLSIKPVFPATVLEFLLAAAFLLVVISFLMILIVPFVARLSSSALLYSDGIDLQPAWGERLFLDAHCIKSVRFAKEEKKIIFVRLHHCDTCKCYEDYHENFFRKSLLAGDECKVNFTFSPLSQTVFAQMVSSGKINLNLHEMSDGEFDASWFDGSNKDNQDEVVCDDASCEKNLCEKQIIIENQVVQSPSTLVRIGFVLSILIATAFGLWMVVRSELIPLRSDFLILAQGLIVRSSYRLYGYAILFFGLAGIGFFTEIQSFLILNKWGFKEYLKALGYSIITSAMVFFCILAPQIFFSLRSDAEKIIIRTGSIDNKIIFDRVCLRAVEVGDKASAYIYLDHRQHCCCRTEEHSSWRGSHRVKVRLTEKCYELEPYQFPFDVAVYAYVIAFKDIDLSVSGKKGFWFDCRADDPIDDA